MAKNETIVRTTIRVPESLWDAARHQAIDEKISLQELVIRAVTKYTKGGK
jgi:predicted HicB family RNase H-like nuclease